LLPSEKKPCNAKAKTLNFSARDENDSVKKSVSKNLLCYSKEKNKNFKKYNPAHPAGGFVTFFWD
jgi:hypothetical protein